MLRTKHTMWPPPPAALRLQPRQVDIWRVHLKLPADALRALQETLSEDETGRAARFHFQRDRERFIAAHGGLRDILGRYLCVEPRQLEFRANPYGKPGLSEAFAGERLEFNLSHSGDFALFAVTIKRQVGVDIELIREDLSTEEIAGRFFSEREVNELLSLSPEQRSVAFFNCWTRKEAYIKACGLGLSLSLDGFDVSLAPGQPAILRPSRPDSQEALRWTLKELEVQPGYAAAVAIEGQDVEFRLCDWAILR